MLKQRQDDLEGRVIHIKKRCNKIYEILLGGDVQEVTYLRYKELA